MATLIATPVPPAGLAAPPKRARERIDERVALPDRWPPLLVALRRTTRPDQARVEAYMRMGGRSPAWGQYRDFLAIHRMWLSALAARLDEAAGAQWAPTPDPRLAALDRALLTLGSHGGGIPPARGRAEALGFQYVHEGFRLGCRLLARQLRRLGLEPEDGAARLEGVGPGTGQAWPVLVEALARVPSTEHAAVLQSAARLLCSWRRWSLVLEARPAALPGPASARAGA